MPKTLGPGFPVIRTNEKCVDFDVQVSGGHLSISNNKIMIKWNSHTFVTGNCLHLIITSTFLFHVTVLHQTHIIREMLALWGCKVWETDWHFRCIPSLQVVSIHDSDLPNSSLLLAFNRLKSHIETFGRPRHHNIFQVECIRMNSSGVENVWVRIWSRPDEYLSKSRGVGGGLTLGTFQSKPETWCILCRHDQYQWECDKFCPEVRGCILKWYIVAWPLGP